MLRILAIVAVAGLVVSAQAPPDIQTRGPQVGDVVPGFELVDQNGATQTVQSVAGPKGTMLVFFRSADW